MRSCAQSRYCASVIGGPELFVHIGREGVVDLHVESGIGNGLVFRVQHIREREEQRLLISVMLVFHTGECSRQCHHREEILLWPNMGV
jgi:hypothetical protein